MERLDQLHAGYRACLNLSDLSVEDVLEILYECKGMITHMEIFNLKDHVDGKASSYPEISELQKALNEGNVITLKASHPWDSPAARRDSLSRIAGSGSKR